MTPLLCLEIIRNQRRLLGFVSKAEHPFVGRALCPSFTDRLLRFLSGRSAQSTSLEAELRRYAPPRYHMGWLATTGQLNNLCLTSKRIDPSIYACQKQLIKRMKLMYRTMFFALFFALVLLATSSNLLQAQSLKAEQQSDRVVLSYKSSPLMHFVFKDNDILRPYIAHVKTLSGNQVTRNHPPIAGTDPVDHPTMHPGIWLAFGVLNDQDFWRNKASVVHQSFIQAPEVQDNQVRFVTESLMLDQDGKSLCKLDTDIRCLVGPAYWTVIWQARFHGHTQDLRFGDQEEMGFGARVATALSEKKGGLIVNSAGEKTAKDTWGKRAEWCDYSGTIDNRKLGITLMTSSTNDRFSLWHNRDYGLFVANPFGRKTMKYGEASEHKIAVGQEYRLCFGACIHETDPTAQSSAYDPAKAYADFLKLSGQ